MKEKLYFIRTVICISLCLVSSLTKSQTPGLDVDTWSSFINHSKLHTVWDTCFIQTFTENIGNNWNYTLTGNASVFDAYAYGIENASEGLALKLGADSEVRFENIKPEGYLTHRIDAPYAVVNMTEGEDLMVSAIRTASSPLNNHKWVTVKGVYSSPFKEAKEQSITPKHSTIMVGYAPSTFQLNIGTATDETMNGFYAIDSVFVLGSLRKYSLFTGSGNWKEEERWSQKVLLPQQCGLINGHISISDIRQCDSLFLGKGNLSITRAGSLSVNKLFMNTADASFQSQGEIHIAETITVRKLFPGKGKWYFISFPFDVYIPGIESGWEFKDDTFKGSGNYFYVQTYNGDKRAQTNQSVNNWKIVSTSSVAEKNGLIFEKGKGYLIALDAKATKSEIHFTSSGVTPTDFGKSGTIYIQMESFPDGKSNPHTGWYLCGNPLASPLPISAINKEDLSGGSIYIYNGKDYDAHTNESNYAIPPYSAFFVKAKKNTPLQVNVADTNNKPFLLPTDLPVNLQTNDPLTEEEKIPEILSPESNIRIRTTEEGIHITNLTNSGELKIINLNGQIIHRQSVQANQTFIPLSLAQGLYILHIQSGKHKIQHKFVRGK